MSTAVGVGVVGKQKMTSIKVIQSTAIIEMGRLYEKKKRRCYNHIPARDRT